MRKVQATGRHVAIRAGERAQGECGPQWSEAPRPRRTTRSERKPGLTGRLWAASAPRRTLKGRAGDARGVGGGRGVGGVQGGTLKQRKVRYRRLRALPLGVWSGRAGPGFSPDEAALEQPGPSCPSAGGSAATGRTAWARKPAARLPGPRAPASSTPPPAVLPSLLATLVARRGASRWTH